MDKMAERFENAQPISCGKGAEKAADYLINKYNELTKKGI